MRVVLDTNIVISACWKPGGNESKAVALKLTFCISDTLEAEYREVAQREKFAQHRECLEALIGSIVKAAHRVQPAKTCAACSDPGDNYLLDCALAAGAQYLVTGNLRHFPAEWQGIQVINARRLLDLSQMLANTLFYVEVDELLSVVDRLGELMEEARIPYELVGGMAVFLHMRSVSEENARLTNDVDVAIRRADLDTLKRRAPNHGFEYRHAAGIDMLIDAEKRKAKGAIHFVFAGEKVRPDYVAPVPEITNPPFAHGVRIAPIEHLLEMKLTSNRLKDMTHVRDLLNVGLITPEMETALAPALRERLDYIKGRE